MDEWIPFHKPTLTGQELKFIIDAYAQAHFSGDGPFTKQCHSWLEEVTQCYKALLTQSCTAALDMSAILLNIKPGDEVILPSFTFVSTANAFVLAGATPVFVDIREDTLNINEKLIEDAITSKTKAIIPVHYAGVACEMDSILDIAKRHHLSVVEDAAQGVCATYKGRALGSIGDLGTYSFHASKNIISGEGGALLVNQPGLALRAEIIREKGTDRSQFFRGEVDKYTWQDIGSSYLPSEITAAFLWAQLEQAFQLTKDRLVIWHHYHDLLAPLEEKGLLRRPIIPKGCEHNAHMYYILLPEGVDRQTIMDCLRQESISTVFHYVPLHSSPAGTRYGRVHGDMLMTNLQSERILRLPFWDGLTKVHQSRIVDSIERILRNTHF